MEKNLAMSRKVHIIGIGGSGVSALAGLLAHEGKKLSGSDMQASDTTKHLQSLGISVSIGNDGKNIPEGTELVIYSLAIDEKNPELAHAKREKIPMQSYPEALGAFAKNYFTIAVCGTHGKSTITALISKILIENNFDPTVVVGTKLRELGNQNYRSGKSKIMVIEACEYKRAFLNYSPRVIVLHTLDPDHFDYYKDFEDYLSAFRDFTQKLPRDGYFFANLDDEDVHEILKAMELKQFPHYNVFTYSTQYPSSTFYLKEKTIFEGKDMCGEMAMKIPGLHNRTNALAAFSVAKTLGVASADILKSINNYEGAHRRFEIKGRTAKTVFIDDYAHHPEEIKATLQGAREKFPTGKICVIFQPHQYSRTKNLFEEFSTSFNNADAVIVPNIYKARDSSEDISGTSAQNLVNEIKKHHKNARYGDGLEKTHEYLKEHASEFDVVMTMGAGDVGKILENL